MALLHGSIAFERYRVTPSDIDTFTAEHLEILEQHACGKFETSSAENVHVGFLGGNHLFDRAFELEKNIINDALHCSVRIDSHQIPSAIRNAWLQMELQALTAENPERRPTKAQRQEAKDAVEQRCEDEIRTGKYLRMQQFPVLWDARHSVLYFGGSSAAASGHAADLFERAFEIELQGVSAGTLAQDWASRTGKTAELDDLLPASFHPHQSTGSIAWIDDISASPTFLGNEFLLWLWWQLENEADTIDLPDGSDVTVMLAKTLSLECPLGENGKETLSAESPVKLPEALQAVRSGKLPRKTGMTLVRHGRQYDLVLQAETFAVGAAKIHADEDAEGRAVFEDRIDAIRSLDEATVLLFETFLARRVAASWEKELNQLRKWLSGDAAQKKRPAA